MAKYPEYKTKYKSLSKKDKQDAKYISKTTPAQRQFNSIAGDVVSTIAAPLGALRVLPKATRVVKELATKFTQAKKTLPEVSHVKNKSLTDADKAFYSGANKTPKDKAINKMLQEYTKKHRKTKLGSEFDEVPWQGQDILRIKKPKGWNK